GASRQQISLARDWRRHRPAAAVHLYAAVPGVVRDRGDPAMDLAMAVFGRPCVLPGRRSGEADHPAHQIRARRTDADRADCLSPSGSVARALWPGWPPARLGRRAPNWDCRRIPNTEARVTYSVLRHVAVCRPRPAAADRIFVRKEIFA